MDDRTEKKSPQTPTAANIRPSGERGKAHTSAPPPKPVSKKNARELRRSSELLIAAFAHAREG